jgi:hypothetical protein
MPVVNCWDIDEALGINTLDCEFAQMAANGSYVSLDLSYEHIKELEEDIADEARKNEGVVIYSPRSYMSRLQNELAVVKALRATTQREEVLIYIMW